MKTSKLKPLITLLALLFGSAAAVAQPYAGADYAFIDADEVDLGALAVKGGYQINEWAAVEGRIGYGVDDDDYFGGEAELNEYYGGYFVAGLPNESIFYPYAIVGYTKGEAKSTFANGSTFTDDESDFSYGIGSRMKLKDNLSTSLEVIRYVDNDQVELDAINLGVVFKF